MTIRFYQEGDKAAIQKLYRKVFQKERSDEQWNWKFKEQPHQLNPFILVYEHDGHIAGHIALWVVNAYTNGEESLIGMRVDTMVDPDAQGMGIYKKMNERMLDEAHKHGISVLYGFPAAKAKDLLLAYTNASDLGNVTRYMMILNPVGLASAILPFLRPMAKLGTPYKYFKLRNRLDNDMESVWQVKEVSYCDAKFDRLAEETSSIKPILLKRDAAYLNWRFHNRPGHDYTMLSLYKNSILQGYIVVKKEVTQVKKGYIKIGYIVDFLGFENEEVWEMLIKAGINELKDTDIIQTWAFPETIAATTMQQLGINEKDKPMPFIVHHLASAETEQNHWWLTQADVDSF